VRIPLIVLLALAGSPAKPVWVKGQATVMTRKVTQWGGAPPSAEELRARREPPVSAPLRNQKLLVRPGNENREVQAIELPTDADGGFALQLQPGTWCVVERTKLKVVADGGGAFPRYQDPTCLARMRTACDAVWTISDEPEQVVTFTANRTVGGPPPCYIGPPPPSAPHRSH
jgi:hypothetical protein